MTSIITTSGPDFTDADIVQRDEQTVTALVPLMAIPKWHHHYPDTIEAAFATTDLPEWVENQVKRDGEKESAENIIFPSQHEQPEDYDLEERQAMWEQFEETWDALQNHQERIEIPWTNITYILWENSPDSQ